MDFDQRRAFVRGEEVHLRRKEFELLRLLVENSGRVLTRDVLIDRVWGTDYIGDTKTLDVHIKRLRSRIEADPSVPVLITTVRGVGYRFAVAQPLKLPSSVTPRRSTALLPSRAGQLECLHPWRTEGAGDDRRSGRWTSSSTSSPTSSSSSARRARCCGATPGPKRCSGSRWRSTEGRSALDLVHPDDLELVGRSLVSIQAKEIGTILEVRAKTPGGWRLLELIGTPVSWFADGAVLFSMRDLTDRRRFEVAHDEVARFRSLVHNAAAITMLVSADGCDRGGIGRPHPDARARPRAVSRAAPGRHRARGRQRGAQGGHGAGPAWRHGGPSGDGRGAPAAPRRERRRSPSSCRG